MGIMRKPIERVKNNRREKEKDKKQGESGRRRETEKTGKQKLILF